MLAKEADNFMFPLALNVLISSIFYLLNQVPLLHAAWPIYLFSCDVSYAYTLMKVYKIPSI